MNAVFCVVSALPVALTTFAADSGASTSDGRIRYIIETDVGGDLDDEQSFVRFLLYANEWDLEGIIANRARARDGENLNPERTGLGILRRMLRAYGQCYPNLVGHDPRYPSPERLLEITVPGYEPLWAAGGFHCVRGCIELRLPGLAGTQRFLLVTKNGLNSRRGSPSPTSRRNRAPSAWGPPPRPQTPRTEMRCSTAKPPGSSSRSSLGCEPQIPGRRCGVPPPG